MTQSLKDKTAVITGASRGIGLHIARAFVEAGAKIVITGRKAETLAIATDELGPAAYAIVCDQMDPESISKMAEGAMEHLGGAPDVLVNNAGYVWGGSVLKMTLKAWNKVIGTNLTGVFLTTKAFLPAMIEKNRGDIFMISSMSGKTGDPRTSAYNASKFGLQGFSQALNHEVRRHNIRVMVMNPSSVDTGEDVGPKDGPGIYLHAADLAGMIVHISAMPGRTLVRDMDIWGTNPFKD